MSVLVDGTSVITAGLDHWYDQSETGTLALEEFVEHDWRLESRLKVSEFRLPPDYRFSTLGNDDRNIRLTVPVLRFPLWSFCMYCKRLQLGKLTMKSALECPDPKHDGQKFKPRMSQVPFVAICVGGHLDDFPFDKWVHKSLAPRCNGPLRLVSRGGGGLESQVVTCEACNAERSLRGITEANKQSHGEEQTVLSQRLTDGGEPYLCRGASPWLGVSESICDFPVRGALRAAGNVYFPKIESSIYLPRKDGAVSEEVHQLIRHPAVSATFKTLHAIAGQDFNVAQLRELLQQNVPEELFAPISDDELAAAYFDFFGMDTHGTNEVQEIPTDAESLTGDEVWRHPEFLKIRETPTDDFLSAKDPGVHENLRDSISRVRSVDVLRETRVLRGFTRVREGELKLSEGKAQLRRRILKPSQDWLPAYVVKGEGIYFELDEQKLDEWEHKPSVIARTQRIETKYLALANERGLNARRVTPRLVLIHSLAHLLINELVFKCGYSSASLRERLYVGDSIDRRMSGVLIYTAAGDSEGTLGGLVRMSRPENLRQVFTSALEGAKWCSTDPVCMDSGEKGQGPDSCNLAACHGCSLVPETSCEHFNRFLDRGLVIGTFDDPDLAFFRTSR